jgi:hypothetical protein
MANPAKVADAAPDALQGFDVVHLNRDHRSIGPDVTLCFDQPGHPRHPKVCFRRGLLRPSAALGVGLYPPHAAKTIQYNVCLLASPLARKNGKHQGEKRAHVCGVA